MSKKTWSFENGLTGDKVSVHLDELFDGDAFVQYLEQKSNFKFAVNGQPQQSPYSNSHYFMICVLDDDGNEADEFALMVSDHVASGHYKGSGTPCEASYSEMPQSQEWLAGET